MLFNLIPGRGRPARRDLRGRGGSPHAPKGEEEALSLSQTGESVAEVHTSSMLAEDAPTQPVGAPHSDPAFATSPRVHRGRGETPRTGSGLKRHDETPAAHPDPRPASDGVAEKAAGPASPPPGLHSDEQSAPAMSRAGDASPMEASMPFDGEDDLPYSASGRLGVLRRLFFTPGFSEGHPETESPVRTERDAGRSSYGRGSFSPAEPVTEDAPPSPMSVIAQPEILRPKNTAAPVEKEKEPLRTVPTPVRRDTADDIETLPSWRGQYRKKRFPKA